MTCIRRPKFSTANILLIMQGYESCLPLRQHLPEQLMSNGVDCRRARRRTKSKPLKIKQKPNSSFFFHPSSPDSVHCISLRKLNYVSELWCQKSWLPEVENSASQPFSPGCLNTWTPLPPATHPHSQAQHFESLEYLKNGVRLFRVPIVLLPCVFPFVKIGKGGDEGRMKDAVGGRVREVTGTWGCGRVWCHWKWNLRETFKLLSSFPSF